MRRDLLLRRYRLHTRFAALDHHRGSRASYGTTGGKRAEGWIREGDFFEALKGGDLELSAGQERPGTYDVLVRKEGFDDWRATGVHVVLGLCHVETVKLKANLAATAAS